MCGDKAGQKFMTSGQYFEQCENSVKMRAWFEELAESGNIIAKVLTWLAAQIREILRSKRKPKVDDERPILYFNYKWIIWNEFKDRNDPDQYPGIISSKIICACKYRAPDGGWTVISPAPQSCYFFKFYSYNRQFNFLSFLKFRYFW